MTLKTPGDNTRAQTTENIMKQVADFTIKYKKINSKGYVNYFEAVKVYRTEAGEYLASLYERDNFNGDMELRDIPAAKWYELYRGTTQGSSKALFFDAWFSSPNPVREVDIEINQYLPDEDEKDMEYFWFSEKLGKGWE